MGFVMGTCSRIYVLDFPAASSRSATRGDAKLIRRCARISRWRGDADIAEAASTPTPAADVATLARVVSAEVSTASPPTRRG